MSVHNAIDVHVGSRIRKLRLDRGLSRQDFGDLIQMNTEQVAAIEDGAARIRAAQLFAVCEALSVPISSFYESLQLGSPEPSELRAAE